MTDYPKGRKRFVVAGHSPYMSLVRDYFIKNGWYLVPWDNAQDADLALLGGDLDNTVKHPPLAQIELLLMGTQDVENIVILSSPHLTVPSPDLDKWYPEARATWLYAKCMEHSFFDAYGDDVLSIRPVNIFGPDVDNYFKVWVEQAKTGQIMMSPGNPLHKSTFTHQDDFLDSLIYLYSFGIGKVIDTGFEKMTYQNFLRNIWKFTNGTNSEPIIQSIQNPVWHHESNRKLELLNWKPKHSVRSSLFSTIVGGV